MEDINVKSVRYPEVTDQKFEKIALKLGRTKRQVFIQMVDYFYKSKKDPMDLNDELLKNTLAEEPPAVYRLYQNAGKYAARTDEDINGQNRRIAAADH
jgi:hypothetical protein